MLRILTLLSLCLNAYAARPIVRLVANAEPKDVHDVADKLLGTGLVDRVHITNFYRNGNALSPSSQLKKNIDVFFVFHDRGNSPLAEPLGNLLADGVDAGKGVVLAHASRNSINYVGGRFAHRNYFGLVGAQTTTLQRAMIGTRHLPHHPILKNVWSFDGGRASWRNNGQSVHSKAKRVADWSDGKPMIAVRDDLAGRVVQLGFFPPSSDVGTDYWSAHTDGARIMANAVVWAANKSPFVKPPIRPISGKTPHYDVEF